MDDTMDAVIPPWFVFFVVIAVIAALVIGILIGPSFKTKGDGEKGQYICGFNADFSGDRVTVRCDYPLEPPIDTRKETPRG